MRFIDLRGSKGPVNAEGQPNTEWIEAAKLLLKKLEGASGPEARGKIIKKNAEFWGQLREWLLSLSHDKCWYSEARDIFSVLEIEHYRPKNRCRRHVQGEYEEGYWWLAFEWTNYRLCGKVGNSLKGDFFPLAEGSPVAKHEGLSSDNEIPLLLDPACPGDPDLLTFNEDGACGPHGDADAFTRLRVETTTERINLNHGRIKKARQRVWNRCRELIADCRELSAKVEAPGAVAEKIQLTQLKKELRSLVQPDAEFSAVAKACLLKSGIGWAASLAAGC